MTALAELMTADLYGRLNTPADEAADVPPAVEPDRWGPIVGYTFWLTVIFILGWLNATWYLAGWVAGR